MTEPSRIQLIRHAEKPRDGEVGVAADGTPDPLSLSVAGWQRAGALVRAFAAATAPLARPRHLLAARPTEAHPSTRPLATLTPLAQALGVGVDSTWSADEDPDRVAAALRALDGPALVCWRHDTLPALADALLQRHEAPPHWPEERYDLVWIVQLDGPRWNLVQHPQRLLPGDREQTVLRKAPRAPGPVSAATRTR